MTVFQAAVMGLLQGLTEFLPVSSSGHIALGEMLFGLQEAPLTLAIWLHMGTLLAVLVVYWPRLWDMVRHPLDSDLKWLILATLPAIPAALLLGDVLEPLYSGEFLGLAFLLTSAVLLIGDTVNRLREFRHKKVTWWDALIMGIAQAFAALIPGLSRSGSTISAGMCTGLNRRRAADFSFMMSVPAILGSAVLDVKKLFDQAEASGVSFGAQLSTLINQLGGAVPLLVAFIVSAASGFLAIRGLLAVIQKRGFRVFAAYTGLLGAFLIVWQLFY